MTTKKENAVATTNKDIEKPKLDLSQYSQFKSENGIQGFEDLDQSDIKLPRIKLLQKTSKEVDQNLGGAGQFYNTVTKESTDTVKCILLSNSKSRVMWKQPFKRGEKPECRSFNGKVRYDGAKKCADCPYQRWEDDGKPQCNMSYMWLAIDSHGTPFRIQASGASVSPTKDFITQIIGNNIPPFCYVVELSSIKESNDSGTYYVLHYEIVDMVDVKEVPKLMNQEKALKSMFSRANEIDNENLEADGDIIDVDSETVVDTPSNQASTRELF